MFLFLSSVIHLFPWSGILDENYELSETFQVPDIKTGKMVRLMTQLTKKEEEMFRNMVRRINNVVSVSHSWIFYLSLLWWFLYFLKNFIFKRKSKCSILKANPFENQLNHRNYNILYFSLLFLNFALQKLIILINICLSDWLTKVNFKISTIN